VLDTVTVMEDMAMDMIWDIMNLMDYMKIILVFMTIMTMRTMTMKIILDTFMDMKMTMIM